MRFTIFTPTFNRAYIIKHLYYSLQKQTFIDFEWLVVDDGSTDDTYNYFEQIKSDNNRFIIRYYKQENGGKHRAINHALQLANGEIFFTVDSDDTLTPNALEKLDKWFSQLPTNEQYCGVAGNLGVSPTQTPNSQLSYPFYEGTALDRYNKVDGERAMAFYTNIHRQYVYPEFPGEKFITEAVTWNRMAHDGYKMRFYNDIIWIYEYREDGLTRAGSRIFLDNPQGYGLWLREKEKFQHATLKERFKLYYTFTCDLSTRYSSKSIASYIGAPYTLIAVMNICHKLSHKLKK